jgi:hypothetical protein
MQLRTQASILKISSHLYTLKYGVFSACVSRRRCNCGTSRRGSTLDERSAGFAVQLGAIVDLRWHAEYDAD